MARMMKKIIRMIAMTILRFVIFCFFFLKKFGGMVGGKGGEETAVRAGCFELQMGGGRKGRLKRVVRLLIRCARGERGVWRGRSVFIQMDRGNGVGNLIFA